MTDRTPPIAPLGDRARAARPAPVAWTVSSHPVPYPQAIAQMDQWSVEVSAGTLPEQVWLLEHPALYTAGTSAKSEHLLTPDRFAVFETGRGGEYTYHGPGQRVVYLALDLRQRFSGDVRAYVHALEAWIIAALNRLDVSGQSGGEQIGVWVCDPRAPSPTPQKIASIGVRVRRGIALHGFALNVAPELDHFSGIVACGGDGDNPTSLENLGGTTDMTTVDAAIKRAFATTILAPSPPR